MTVIKGKYYSSATLLDSNPIKFNYNLLVHFKGRVAESSLFAKERMDGTLNNKKVVIS